ncbi:hypothetical protein [Truepera radiovictrix]|uniref:Uncharacterized protein n=1 Tax=Truepera radiovictrix (strain DSM 17093 / CIP 108686 / LMG 22925 / RQ-24) TaxID=649638 RepID=D7CQF1_TRURR|nr:hypothetical protein [Truepera radiovictrix]ADI14935.1 hypothetical protein Trad_1818 [Truepera radiovictrix DSM 17093]WMT56511.1 hypothetical protein RCV51_10915 [Truepera radiovictrix]
MTPEQIRLFVYRLRHQSVSREELAALSPEDLTAINLHLFRARHRRSCLGGTGPVFYGSMVISEGPGRTYSERTYSEQEILAELGALESWT